MPLIAVLIGLAFGETLGLTVWLGFAVILSGLALARQKNKSA
jgi:drug/metabolite transporter (DMT)-like permease